MGLKESRNAKEKVARSRCCRDVFLVGVGSVLGSRQANRIRRPANNLEGRRAYQGQRCRCGRNAFDADGEFKYGEIYVNVVSDKGLRLIYAPKPAAENMDVLQAQDTDGKFIVKEILEVAKTKGEGWVQYRWINPATNEIAGKTTYVKSVPEREVVVYVGAYK